MKLEDLGEDAFLHELSERYPAPAGVPVGIGDDASVLAAPSGEELLLSVDALVEGAHFERTSTGPRFAGRKAVAVSASDIAAMGGALSAVLLSLVVPRDLEVSSLRELVAGAAERAGEFSAVLVGGNLAATDGGPMVLSVTVFGRVPAGCSLRRSGARAGDGIYVSGCLGAAACGLKLLSKGVRLATSGGIVAGTELSDGPLRLAEDCIRAQLDPEPRLGLGSRLRSEVGATACIDLSDGLGSDLPRLCRASGVSARIEEASLPLSPGLLAWERRFGGDPVRTALDGGEDYELLFTSRDDDEVELLRRGSDIAITRIGEIVPQADRRGAAAVELVRPDGSLEPLNGSGWDHFRPRR